ncbi:tripartite tricarboxylate transporter substrate binding protein [Blastococcus goldschmidtiae]|uniref:Tripartite tricarboxylate transporter substrate binding protein n=1 Tax=Blastococcus goldschmidtiae TaxID=3075546 RepID=A0ABU2K6W8_9ACTN|nr:tripartite tricarboxylate transporter substrate binding protein [Blastococcus sp. DSM 46792]MDT0275930.1 tripartite tricarboxylate transporter substrate binding protein [Blastococcus sp. DSM 46792]
MAAAALALLATTACAPQSDDAEQAASPADSNYPERPVEVVVPYPAGGGSDVLARALVEAVNADGGLGADMQIVNRAGGGGVVGTSEVLSAEADGYTIGFGPEGPITLQPAVQDVPYDPLAMTPLLQVTQSTPVLAVPGDSPYQSLQDFVDAALASPGQVSLGEGPLSYSVPVTLLEEESGATFNRIDYEGDAASLTALLGGNVDATMTQVSAVLPQVETGDVRVLGIVGEEPSEFLPDVPTFQDEGFDVVWDATYFAYGPEGLPEDVQDTLTEAFTSAAESESFREVARTAGLPVDLADAEALEERLTERLARAEDLAEANGGL